MKKATYILSIIILSLLFFGSTVHGQNAQDSDIRTIVKTSDSQVPLKVAKTYCYTDGLVYEHFNKSEYKDTYNEPTIKNLFIKTSIQRVDDKTLILTSKKDSTQFRIVSSKGYLYFGEDDYRVITKALRWRVKKLDTNDKDITIEIYNNRTNELLSKRSYNLIPENRFSDRRFRIELHYFDRTGKEQICDGEQLSKLNINYKIPMRVVVKDWWDITHWIESCNVKFIGTGGEKYVFPCDSPRGMVNPRDYNTLTPKAMEKIRLLRANEKFLITDVVYWVVVQEYV